MTQRNATLVILGLAMLLGAGSGPAAHAGDVLSQSIQGLNFFGTSSACPAKKAPTMETVAPLPAILDPALVPIIKFQCSVQPFVGTDPVKKVRGKYTIELLVRDNETGAFKSFELDSGRFKTNKQGQAGFETEIETEIFADGFESGDVSAWGYTRTNFTNGKKVESSFVECSSSLRGVER